VIDKANADWNFKDIAEEFDDHVVKSIPLYTEGHNIICYLSDFFCHHDSVCYDLGMSTGILLKKLAEHNQLKPRIRWIGVEQEISMLEKANNIVEGIHNIELVHENIESINFEKSDMIISYYTIQFIPPKSRQYVITKIFKALNWGGAFILFEKVRGPDARFQDITTSMYTDFKLRQGFDEKEVITKSRSLKGILEPFSTLGNIDMLKRAGFLDYMTIMKYICFEGFLAIK